MVRKKLKYMLSHREQGRKSLRWSSLYKIARYAENFTEHKFLFTAVQFSFTALWRAWSQHLVFNHWSQFHWMSEHLKWLYLLNITRRLEWNIWTASKGRLSFYIKLRSHKVEKIQLWKEEIWHNNLRSPHLHLNPSHLIHWFQPREEFHI